MFCINSVAHYLGDTPYDDKHSPRDHLVSAILTLGEGYHNFHHQFPMDYRNAFRWYQYDPTKWFIAMCQFVGLATHLRTFPTNEIRKGYFTMRLKELKSMQDMLRWPVSARELPVIPWDSCEWILVLSSRCLQAYAEQCKKNLGSVLLSLSQDIYTTRRHLSKTILVELG